MEKGMAADVRCVSVTIVDDDPVAREVLIRAARSWHFHAQTAPDAEQALQLLESRLTPIVVTDIRMPGRGGVWLVQEVRRRWPDVRIIVLTAGSTADAAKECRRAGAHHYFTKPIKFDELRHVLESTWRSYHRQREARLAQEQLERAVRRQTRRARHTFLSAIDSLVRTMESRDPYTAGHSRRVRHYALALADAIGLDARQRKLLGVAAKLHDIGKVGIPDAILHKPMHLTPEEELIVADHPIIAERILTPVVRQREVLAAIRGHHERVDGTGYPDGLRGDEIPLLARLISVPDCFDALTTSRAYRAALPIETVLDMLRSGAGSHFDPALVGPFVALAPSLLPPPYAGPHFIGHAQESAAGEMSTESRFLLG
jgi:response regulator RpfG family c-di-GMP phosphodiesterase